MSPRFPIFASSSEARTATLQSLLIAAIVITGLYVAREVLLPLALAILLSFVLTPALLFLRRLKLPRVIGVTIVVAFAFAVIFALGWLMSQQATQLFTPLSARARRKNKRASQIGGRFASPREGHRSGKGSGTRARQPNARA
jgi:predicted PurR-regulated permease PerM